LKRTGGYGSASPIPARWWPLAKAKKSVNRAALLEVTKEELELSTYQ
jgi:hypothetical protein